MPSMVGGITAQLADAERKLAAALKALDEAPRPVDADELARMEFVWAQMTAARSILRDVAL